MLPSAGALAVFSGAFLAHQLRQQMPAAALEVYETAVRYQFYHVFALLAVGILSEQIPGKLDESGGKLLYWRNSSFLRISLYDFGADGRGTSVPMAWVF